MLIQHRAPRLKPPGGPVLRIRREHRLAAELRGLILFGGPFGAGLDLVTGVPFAAVSSPTIDMMTDGPALDMSSAGYASGAHHPDWNVSGEITLAWRGVIKSTTGGNLISKVISGGGGGSDTPFSMEYTNNTAGRFSLVRSPNSAAPYVFRVWECGSNCITAGAEHILSVSQGGDMSVAPSFYTEGAPVSGSPVSNWGGVGSGAAGSNSDPLLIGQRADGAQHHDGLTAMALLAARQWDAAEHAGFSADLYGLLEDAPLYHFLATSAVHDLTALGIATGTPTVGTPTLAQIHAFTAVGISAGAPAMGRPTLGVAAGGRRARRGARRVYLPEPDDPPVILPPSLVRRAGLVTQEDDEEEWFLLS